MSKDSVFIDKRRNSMVKKQSKASVIIGENDVFDFYEDYMFMNNIVDDDDGITLASKEEKSEHSLNEDFKTRMIS